MIVNQPPDSQHYRRCLERLLERTLFGDLNAVDVPEAAVWLIRAALEAGEDQRANALVASLESLAAADPDSSILSSAARHAHALLERDAAVLEQVAKALSDPWERASAAEDAAVAWAERSDLDAAVIQFHSAQTEYERLDAREDVARLRWRLRRAGFRRGRWNREDRPVTGWASLTEREHRVTDLVGEGLTNREVAQQLYLSRHTVDYHLRNIFWKLGIHSRVQLARMILARFPSGGLQPF